MLSWLLFLSCTTPDACNGMCQAAADVQEVCLSEWEAQWEDLGYADKSDYLNSCDTWAWEMHLLEKDAQQNGLFNPSSSVHEVCLERHDGLESEALTCESWLSIDWNETPWNR